jgi:hypothetical protein
VIHGKKSFTGAGMSFEMKIPVGTGPGNLQVHLCPALAVRAPLGRK